MGGHNDGCPILIGAPEAMEEWKRGANFGFEEDRSPRSWDFPHYSKTFILGWRAGAAEIDCLVDIAAQSRCFG